MVEYYDIREKKYWVDYESARFYFTSKHHADKFLVVLENQIKCVRDRMLRQYHAITNSTVLAAISAYRRVEPLDFLVTLNGKDYTEYRDIRVVMSFEGA